MLKSEHTEQNITGGRKKKMSVFSDNEEKRFGTGQARHWQYKAVSGAFFVSVLHSVYILLFFLLSLLRLIILPIPSPLYLSDENGKRSGRVKDSCCVFPYGFHFSSQPGLTCSLFSSMCCLRFIYAAFCCHVFLRGKKKRVWMHEKHCTSKNMKRSQEIVSLICWSFASYHHIHTKYSSLHSESVQLKLHSMMINCTPRKRCVFFQTMLSTHLPETWWTPGLKHTNTIFSLAYSKFQTWADCGWQDICVLVLMRSTSLAKMGD